MTSETTASSPAAEVRSGAIGYNGGLTCAINVKDLGASIGWYQDVLGFKLLYRLEDMGWCELATGVDQVSIGLSQVEAPKTAGGATLTFGVDDIDRARQLVESKNARFDGETREIPGMVKLATFFDPDGNTLMFYQDLSK